MKVRELQHAYDEARASLRVSICRRCYRLLLVLAACDYVLCVKSHFSHYHRSVIEQLFEMAGKSLAVLVAFALVCAAVAVPVSLSNIGSGDPDVFLCVPHSFILLLA